MQYTEFILRNRKTGELRKIKTYIDPNAPLRDELGIFYIEFDVVDSRKIRAEFK